MNLNDAVELNIEASLRFQETRVGNRLGIANGSPFGDQAKSPKARSAESIVGRYFTVQGSVA
jgi:hypothetical protein